jgi:hypothetical protein
MEKEVVALQIVNLIKVNDIYIDMATYIIKRSDASIKRTLFSVSADIFAMHMSTLPSEYYYCAHLTASFPCHINNFSKKKE